MFQQAKQNNKMIEEVERIAKNKDNNKCKTLAPYKEGNRIKLEDQIKKDTAEHIEELEELHKSNT